MGNLFLIKSKISKKLSEVCLKNGYKTSVKKCKVSWLILVFIKPISGLCCLSYIRFSVGVEKERKT